MAITFVGAGTFTESTTTNPGFPYPTGLAANDLLVLCFGVNGAAVPSAQTGFTTVIADSSTGDTLVPSLYMGIKFATGSESGSFTSTIAGVTARSGQILAFRGVDLTTPQDVAAQIQDKTSTATANFAIPSQTTTRTGVALVYAAIQNATTGGMTPPTVPATFTEDGDRVSGRNFSDGHLIWSGSGATGSVNPTGNGLTRGLAAVLALRPAASGFTGSAALSGDGSLSTTGARGGPGIQLMSVGTPDSGTTSCSPAYPPGLVAGDLIVLFISCNSGTVVVPSSTTWAQIGVTATSDFTETVLVGKFSLGTESGASLTASAVGSAFIDAQMFRFSGVDAAVVDVAGASNFANNSDGSALTWNAGGRTPVNAGALSIIAARGRVQTGDVVCNTAGWVEIDNTFGTGFYARGDLAAGVATGAVSFTAEARSPANSATSVHAILRPAGGTAFSGSADFAGAGTLATAQVPGPTQVAALSGSGSLGTVQAPSPAQAAALSGAGTLATAQVPRPAVSAALSGAGSLTTAAVAAAAGAATLSGSGSLTTVPVAGAAATVTLSGSGTLATTQKPGPTVAATLSGSGTLATTQTLGPTVTVALTGSGALSTAQSLSVAVTAALAGSGTLATAQVPRPTVVAALTGSGALSTTQSLSLAGAATLTGSGTLTAFRVYDATTVEWASSATGTGWVNPANAVGPDDGTYATWTSAAASAVSAPLEVGFGTFAAVPADASGISVRVRVKGYWS